MKAGTFYFYFLYSDETTWTKFSRIAQVLFYVRGIIVAEKSVKKERKYSQDSWISEIHQYKSVNITGTNTAVHNIILSNTRSLGSLCFHVFEKLKLKNVSIKWQIKTYNSHLDKPRVHEETQSVQSPLVQSVRAQPCIKYMRSHSFHPFCQPVWGHQEPCHIRTPVNVEFLHETEDVLGEHFGLDLIHAVSGHREAREPPAATQKRTESSKHINQKNPEVNHLVEGTPHTCRGHCGCCWPGLC